MRAAQSLAQRKQLNLFPGISSRILQVFPFPPNLRKIARFSVATFVGNISIHPRLGSETAFRPSKIQGRMSTAPRGDPHNHVTTTRLRKASRGRSAAGAVTGVPIGNVRLGSGEPAAGSRQGGGRLLLRPRFGHSHKVVLCRRATINHQHFCSTHRSHPQPLFHCWIVLADCRLEPGAWSLRPEARVEKPDGLRQSPNLALIR